MSGDVHGKYIRSYCLKLYVNYSLSSATFNTLYYCSICHNLTSKLLFDVARVMFIVPSIHVFHLIHSSCLNVCSCVTCCPQWNQKSVRPFSFVYCDRAWFGLVFCYGCILLSIINPYIYNDLIYTTAFYSIV